MYSYSPRIFTERLLLAGLLATALHVDEPALRAQDRRATVAKTAKIADKDFGKQLPRVPASTAQQSLKSIVMSTGFQLELAAAEPLVRDPVAIDFDERGRMYVVQLPPYNSYIVPNSSQRGSIVALEDSDGDGVYDRRLLFASELNYPTAVACWDGGIFVGDAPDLLYLKDTDGDGVADLRKVVFTGFGKDKAGEAHLNSIRWGLDNRFHLSTNLAGGEIKATAAKAKDAGPISVRGRGFVFDPRDLSTFELTSGGGQHGMSMDDWGNKFVCSNSVPAQTLIYDDRYVERNPHLSAPSPAVDIAPQGKHTKLFRISPPEPWRVLRTRLRREGQFRGSDEGGKPFGFFTGATGITIYRGDAWPASYRGNLFVGDVANNLVYRATLELEGLKPVAKRADKDQEFLAARDIWFRPVQFSNAPDGTLFALDMCRELIEGAAFLPPEFFKYLDAASGNDRGRIYRIVAKQTSGHRAVRGAPRLDEASTRDLVSLLEHRNGWHRDTAARLLYQRQDRAAVPHLKELAAASKLPIGRVTALYSLDGLGAMGDQIVLSALADPQPQVLIQAMRLAESRSASNPLIRARLIELADHTQLAVRYQAAFSLGSCPGAASATALARIATRDGRDRWMRLAVLSSLDRGADRVFQTLISDRAFRESAHGREMLVTLARQIGRAGRSSEMAVVVRAIGQLGTGKIDKSLSDAIVQSLVEKQTGAIRQQILAAADGKAGVIVGQIVADARKLAMDETKSLSDRADAVRKLRLSSFADAKPLLVKLLAVSQPQPVQAAALETAAEFSEAAVADLLLDAWPALSPALRRRATETLLSRPNWVTHFLDAVESKQVARGELDLARVQLLRRHPDPEIARRVSTLFADVRLTARQDVVKRYQASLKMQASAERGKLVFKKSCSVCHRLEDVGTAIGADLKGIRQRGLPAVMLNILDPNREVKPQFLTYSVETDKGQVLTGMIVAESANGITLRKVDGTNISIQRNQIERMRSLGISFMPEGLEKSVDQQAMADLLSYLNSLE